MQLAGTATSTTRNHLINTSAIKRIETIDLLKGLVMIIMALDHVRDYFSSQAFLFNPIDPTQTTTAIYFTRFITNFCAPTFCFLAGLSAFMSGRKKTKAELSVFLIKRGFWLMLIELTVVNFAWQFDPYFRVNGVAVIWALGVSMVVLAGLIHLPRNVMLAFCVVVIFGHNLLDGINMPGNLLWSVLHKEDTFNFENGLKFYVTYPIIPWIAVMPLGYYFGKFYNKDVSSHWRKKTFNIVGVAAIVLFVLLRWLNVYGNLFPWVNIDNGVRTAMSFFNVTKYPASLCYLLITLGPMLLFLGNTEHLKGKLVSFFSMFGRVPFFYYLLHLYVMHLLAAFAGQLSGFGWKLLVMPDWILEMPSMKGYGFNLGVVYAVWVLVIAITYPFCKWFDKYKTDHKEKWWLSYL